jgi:hypothetical protein
VTLPRYPNKNGRVTGNLVVILSIQMPDAMIVPVTIDGTWELLRYNFWPVPYGIKITITVGLPEKLEQDSSKQIQRIEGEIASVLVQ